MQIGLGLGLTRLQGVMTPPVNSVAPVISGTPTAGQQLSTTNGTWYNSPTSYTYQWTAGGTPISGATASTFTLDYAQEGQDIRCVVTAINSGGSTSAESNALTFAAIELVNDGTFTTGAGWTTPSGWALSGGKLNGTSVTAFATATTTAINPPGLVAGVTYTAVFTVSSVSAGGVRLAFTGGTQVVGTTRTAPGTYTQDFVANSGNLYINVQAGSGGFTGSVDNLSVKKK